MTQDPAGDIEEEARPVPETRTEALQREVNEQLVLAALHAHEAKQEAETRLATMERLKTIFDEAPSAICLLRGPDLTIELVNPRLLALCGKTGTVTGLPLLDAVPELRGQGLDLLLRAGLATGVSQHGKEVPTRLDRRGDGVLGDVYLDLSVVMLRGEGAVPGSVFVHAYDVTDKVAARRRAEALQKEAETANHFKDEFLATMSHELRTPLTAILGWSTLLRRSVFDKEATDRALASIERNARSQAHLIDDLLDVSRIMSGKLRLDMRRVDVDAVVCAAVDVLRPGAELKNVALNVELGAQDGIHLLADADRLQQVVWNLVSNAIKFTASGGTVSVHVSRALGAVRLVVRDTGRGIPAEHLPFIFERFRQVDSTATRMYGGLGLGLAIVRHLVELHGGSVSAESDGPGLGATFTVHVPVRPVELAESTQLDPLRTASHAVVVLTGVRILVVEDDEDARLFIRSVLERAGAIVHTAASARDAFALVERYALDVMISDIGMPEEDGFSLMRRVRALPADRGGRIRAIALTAFARRDDALRAAEAGFQIHLAKPVDPEALARNVVQLLALPS
jgi:signal transduction histidine kinase/ActR/RegA family two-component response regulator